MAQDIASLKDRSSHEQPDTRKRTEPQSGTEPE
jgi:hypothetical protein